MGTRLDTGLTVTVVSLLILALSIGVVIGRASAGDVEPGVYVRIEPDRTPAACRCGERGQA